MQTYPVNLVQVVRLKDRAGDDASAERSLHNHIDAAEEDVLLARDGRRVHLLLIVKTAPNSLSYSSVVPASTVKKSLAPLVKSIVTVPPRALSGAHSGTPVSSGPLAPAYKLALLLAGWWWAAGTYSDPLPGCTGTTSDRPRGPTRPEPRPWPRGCW